MHILEHIWQHQEDQISDNDDTSYFTELGTKIRAATVNSHMGIKQNNIYFVYQLVYCIISTPTYNPKFNQSKYRYVFWPI